MAAECCRGNKRALQFFLSACVDTSLNTGRVLVVSGGWLVGGGAVGPWSWPPSGFFAGCRTSRSPQDRVEVQHNSSQIFVDFCIIEVLKLPSLVCAAMMTSLALVAGLFLVLSAVSQRPYVIRSRSKTRNHFIHQVQATAAAAGKRRCCCGRFQLIWTLDLPTWGRGSGAAAVGKGGTEFDTPQGCEQQPKRPRSVTVTHTTNTCVVRDDFMFPSWRHLIDSLRAVWTRAVFRLFFYFWFSAVLIPRHSPQSNTQKTESINNTAITRNVAFLAELFVILIAWEENCLTLRAKNKLYKTKHFYIGKRTAAFFRISNLHVYF